MLRRAEALLDPTARPPDPPPTDGLWPFYWHFIRQERWLVVALFMFGGLIAMLDVTIPAFIGRVVGLVSTHAPADLLRETWPQLARHGRRAAAGAAVGVHRPRGADQPDREPGPVQHGPLAEPLARGAAELDVLPERLRRPHRQPRAADRPVAAREPGDGVRRRLVHHRVWQQRAGAAGLRRLAPDAADPAVVLRLRRHPGLFRAAPARALAGGVRDALNADRARGGQLHQHPDGQAVLPRARRGRVRARGGRSCTPAPSATRRG